MPAAEGKGQAAGGGPSGDLTRAVDRALRLMHVVATSDAPVSLMDAARRTDLPTSTASRLLRGLESSGFASRDADGRYVVGTLFLRVAATALGGRPYLRTAQTHLEALAGATGESAYLAVVDPARDLAIYVQYAPSPRAIRHGDGLGHSAPMRGTAVGAALRGRTGPRGFAVARGSLEPGVTAVAAPVCWFGEIVAAVAVLGPSARIDDEEVDRIGGLVVAQAAALSVTGTGAPAAGSAGAPGLDPALMSPAQRHTFPLHGNRRQSAG